MRKHHSWSCRHHRSELKSFSVNFFIFRELYLHANDYWKQSILVLFIFFLSKRKIVAGMSSSFWGKKVEFYSFQLKKQQEWDSLDTWTQPAWINYATKITVIVPILQGVKPNAEIPAVMRHTPEDSNISYWKNLLLKSNDMPCQLKVWETASIKIFFLCHCIYNFRCNLNFWFKCSI